MAEIALMAAMVAGTGLSVVNSVNQGRAAKKQADFQAAQLEQQAGQKRAQAQRMAIDERRKADVLASNLRAAAGVSGGGVSDPTVGKLAADIAGQGEYNALATVFNAQEQALSAETQAAGARVSGRTAQQAGYIGAAADLLSGVGQAGTMYMKYGGGGAGSGSGKAGASKVK